LLKYRDFCDFQDGGRRHLGFSKIRNFNGLFHVGANMRHHAKFYQNQTVAEIRQFNGFQMVAVHHLGFVACLFGPSTMSTWWCLVLCKIWLELMQ